MYKQTHKEKFTLFLQILPLPYGPMYENEILLKKCFIVISPTLSVGSVLNFLYRKSFHESQGSAQLFRHCNWFPILLNDCLDVVLCSLYFLLYKVFENIIIGLITDSKYTFIINFNLVFFSLKLSLKVK